MHVKQFRCRFYLLPPLSVAEVTELQSVLRKSHSIGSKSKAVPLISNMSIINVQASDLSQEQISRKFMESDQKAKDARESAEVNFCTGWDREGQLDEIANEAEEIARLWKAEVDACWKLPINSPLSETEIIHLKEAIYFRQGDE